MSKKPKKFLDYWIIIIKHWKILAKNTIMVVLFTVIISLLLTYKYTATATILPPSSDQTSMLGLLTPGLSGGLANISRMAGGIPGLSTPSDLFAAIMNSGRIKGDIISRFDLKKEFKAKTNHDAIRELDDITHIDISPEGIISVSVTYKDKYLAADIANAFVEELDKFNTETAMTAGKKYRIFIEERLSENEDSLGKAEEYLKNFQEKHRTLVLDTEITNAIEVIAEIKSQIILLEVRKGTLSSSSTANNPYIYNINNELRELKKQLKKIEDGSATQNASEFGAGFSVPLSEMPEVSLKYFRLVRDVKVQEAIFEVLSQQYEQAKIMEVKDTPTVQFLDKAGPPEKRSYPVRSRIVIFAFILSLIINVPIAFIMEFISDTRNNPSKHQTFIRVISDINKGIVLIKTYLRSKLYKANKK